MITFDLPESNDPKSLNRKTFISIHVRSVNPYLRILGYKFPDGSVVSKPDTDTSRLLNSTEIPPNKTPKDKWHLAYFIYFTIGFGYLLPWNAFITAVDYFSFLYPEASIDPIFVVVYMFVSVVSLVIIILCSHISHVKRKVGGAHVRKEDWWEVISIPNWREDQFFKPKAPPPQIKISNILNMVFV